MTIGRVNADSVSKMIFEGTKDPDENEATLVITNEELKKEIDEVAKKVEEAVSQIEYDAEKRQKDLDDMAAARLAYLNKDSKEEKYCFQS